MGRTIVSSRDVAFVRTPDVLEARHPPAPVPTDAGDRRRNRDAVDEFAHAAPVTPGARPFDPGIYSDALAAKPDDYFLRLIKYIPTEVVALYLMLHGFVLAQPQGEHAGLLWSVFWFCAIATPLYLWRIQKVDKALQLAISTVAFAVWVFGMGGPHVESLRWYQPIYGALVLPMYTFLIPLIEP